MSGEVVSYRPLEEDSDIAAFVTQLWSKYDNYKEGVMERWHEVQEYRNATDTTEISSSSNVGDHTVHIPIIEKIAPQLEAIILQTLIPHDDWFDFTAYDRASAKAEKKHLIKEYLKNRYRVSDLQLTLSKWVSDIVDTGNAFLHLGFENNIRTKNGKVRYVGPATTRISPYDIVFDPVCTSFHESWKVVREVITVGELYKRSKNGQFSEGVVDELLNDRNHFMAQSHNQTKKDAQYVPTGFNSIQAYYESGYIELLWFYGSIYDTQNKELLENRTIVVADNKHVVHNEETPSWDGKPYITHTGWQPRQDNLWYRGPLENLIGMNYIANHRENAKETALDKMIEPDTFISGDVEPLYDEDTGQITYLNPDGGGQVVEIGVNSQFLQFDTQISVMRNLCLDTIGLPPEFLGFRTAGEKTLGEVTVLQEGAMRPFLHKLKNIEKSLEFMLNAHLQLTYANVGDVTQIALPSMRSGALMDTVLTKKDFEVNGGFVPRGASRFSQKQKFMADLIQINSTGLMQLVAPHMSSLATARKVEDFLEVGGEGLIKPWAQITEQGEAEMARLDVQRSIADEASKKSLQEDMIDAEDEAMLPPEEEEEV